MNIIMTKSNIDFFKCTPIKTFCILNLNVFCCNWLIIQIYNFLFSCSNPDISILKCAILFGKTFQESCYIMYWIYFNCVTEKSLTLVNHLIHHCLYTHTCSAFKSQFNNHMTSLFSGKQIKQIMSWSWEVGRQNEFNNQLFSVNWTSFEDKYNNNTLASKTDHWQYSQ